MKTSLWNKTLQQNPIIVAMLSVGQKCWKNGDQIITAFHLPLLKIKMAIIARTDSLMAIPQ